MLGTRSADRLYRGQVGEGGLVVEDVGEGLLGNRRAQPYQAISANGF